MTAEVRCVDAREPFTFATGCSGICAPELAWSGLPWSCKFMAEIDRDCNAVSSYHFPEPPNLGAIENIGVEHGPVDLWCAGTPCQSFSVAGLRAGLDDPRGNLALEFLRVARDLRAEWVVWENVPGVLSSSGGRDFGAFLGGLEDLGYGWAYRVLDAQYFGVPQQRNRVFVVGHLGDWRGPAAVLLERESLCWNPAPRREAGENVAALTAAGVGTCGADDNQAQAGHLVAPCLSANYGKHLHQQSRVRRLTPRECERLQGFPDDWTLVPKGKKFMADSPRYRMVGNSMAVPVMRWIGERIERVRRLNAAALPLF